MVLRVCPFVRRIAQNASEGLSMTQKEVTRFWLRSGFFCGFWIIRDALPLGDRASTETPLCAAGGSTVLSGGVRAVVASRYYLNIFCAFLENSLIYVFVICHHLLSHLAELSLRKAVVT